MSLMNITLKYYFRIIGINSRLILLGISGLVHNASALAISLSSMKNLLETKFKPMIAVYERKV